MSTESTPVVNQRPRIRIEVSGSQSQIGTTRATALIVNALRNAGFDEIKVDCQHGDVHDIRDAVLEGFDLTRLVPVPAVDVVDCNVVSKSNAPKDDTWDA